jgi:hypothetical protein
MARESLCLGRLGELLCNRLVEGLRRGCEKMTGLGLEGTWWDLLVICGCENGC